MGVYKYVAKKDYYFQTHILGREFNSEWIHLNKMGMIRIKAGYAWNGCSPKWLVSDFFIGTPDGAIDPKTYEPITFLASMLHDAICQYKNSIPISRREADVLFLIKLLERGFDLAITYYRVVRMFGGFYGTWKAKKA